MTTDNYKQVLYSDGEGISFGDLNDMQRYLESKIWEQIVHNSIAVVNTLTTSTNDRDIQFGGQDGSNHPTTWAYCLNPGSAYLRPGSANNKIQIAPGVLLQKLAVLTGDDPQVIAYTFAGTEEFTLTNGDATNPRVDLFEMKLEYITADLQSRDFEDATTRIVTSTSTNKKRRVQCTLQVKTGTPAASPVIPDPDTGFVPIGFAVVGETWTTAGNAPIYGIPTVSSGQVVIHDLRVPVSIKPYKMFSPNFVILNNWSIASGAAVATVSGNNSIWTMCPANGRILAIDITHKEPVAGNPLNGISARRASPGDVPVSNSRMFNLANPVNTSLTSCITESYSFLGTNSSPAIGPTIQASATLKIGVPLWSNGRHCPFEYITRSSAGSTIHECTVLQIQNMTYTSGTTLFSCVTFWVAEGL
jgi:hypothetical protein